jgi:hypothetical protein
VTAPSLLVPSVEAPAETLLVTELVTRTGTGLS